MRLLHYSDQYLAEVYSVSQHDKRAKSLLGHKPHGLWLSVEGEDDWPSWCRGEEFRLDKLTHATEVTLTDKPNVLMVTSSPELVAFNEEFGVPIPYESIMGGVIDWARVAERYDGIIIAPYQWKHRLDRTMFWFYSWDCASGCIWQARAIAKLTPIGEIENAA